MRFQTFLSFLYDQRYFSGFITRPRTIGQNVTYTKNTKSVGKPRLSYEAKASSSKAKEASDLADSSSFGALTHGASVKARREGLTNTAHVLREMRENPEEKATAYRKAEVASKKKCMYHIKINACTSH